MKLLPEGYKPPSLAELIEHFKNNPHLVDPRIPPPEPVIFFVDYITILHP